MPRFTAISSSRADHAALLPVAQALNAELINLNVSLSTTHADAARAFARAVVDVTDRLSYSQPDMVILPGDRFEILAAACAAHLLNIPLAHIGGGDVTEGSLDDGMRHAISKLAHLHFTSCYESQKSIILALGEEPWRVHWTGDPAIDGLADAELYDKAETIQQLHVAPSYYLVAYQPATALDDPLAEAEQLVTALRRKYLPCVFTTLNADAFGKPIERLFARCSYDTMGMILDMDRKLYLSAMKHCRVMIGNSSSGFYEAPTLKKAFVNIGDRQKGRIAADSIISVRANEQNILEAIEAAERLDCSNVVNPYGDGHAVARICAVLNNLPERSALLNKKHGGVEWGSVLCGTKSTLPDLGESTQRKSLSDGQQPN